jgi:hypothetical protein
LQFKQLDSPVILKRNSRHYLFDNACFFVDCSLAFGFLHQYFSYYFVGVGVGTGVATGAGVEFSLGVRSGTGEGEGVGTYVQSGSMYA